MSYNHNEIEKNGNNIGNNKECFKALDKSSKPKFYALDMFPIRRAPDSISDTWLPIPQGKSLPASNAQGFNVLHPMGYDAFGLPAEQYAIQTGVHPEKTTKQAIDNFRRQLKSFGYSFDWSRGNFYL